MRRDPLGFLLDAAGWPDTRFIRVFYVVCVLVLLGVLVVIICY